MHSRTALLLSLAIAALSHSPAAWSQLTATLERTGPDETTAALSYGQHNAGTGSPYGQFTVDFSYPAGWTPAASGTDVIGCPRNVPAHIDLTDCQVVSETRVRLTLADLDQDTAFPDVADLGAITFSGTGGSTEAARFAIAVADARDDTGVRDEANFQTGVTGDGTATGQAPDGAAGIPGLSPWGAVLMASILVAGGGLALQGFPGGSD